MAAQVCIDAVFAIALLLPSSRTPQAESLWESWLLDDMSIVAPPLFFAEVTSVLRASVFHRQISSVRGEAAFSQFLRFPVRPEMPPDLQPRAWAFAKQYNLVRAYDAQYLAVADFLGCDFWTADRRLSNSVPVPWLHLV